MVVVGLTGGIASGKTTVSQVLKEEGAVLIDADQIARELVQPHTPAWKDLIHIFGRDILGPDGSIDRKRLGDLVFSNPDDRRELERILHPRIEEEIHRRLEEIRQKAPEAIVVIDAALLVETGHYREMDWVIVVSCNREQQIERLRKRDGLCRERALRILSSQMPLEEKLKVADFVIHNEGSYEETRKKAQAIYKQLKEIGPRKRDEEPSDPVSKGFQKRGGSTRDL